MRRQLLALLTLLIAAIPTGSALAWIGPFQGNDTGGIIAWSPAAQHDARRIAAAHCARYGKLARITSVWPKYGQYIGFSCRLPYAYYVPQHHHRRHRHTVLHVRD